MLVIARMQIYVDFGNDSFIERKNLVRHRTDYKAVCPEVIEFQRRW
jgi:hypothetical protein